MPVLLCEHPFPVLRTWQGLRQDSLRSVGLDAVLSSECVGFGLIQSKQRRT